MQAIEARSITDIQTLLVTEMLLDGRGQPGARRHYKNAVEVEAIV
jgi:hypothetical protein